MTDQPLLITPVFIERCAHTGGDAPRTLVDVVAPVRDSVGVDLDQRVARLNACAARGQPGQFAAVGRPDDLIAQSADNLADRVRRNPVR